MKSFRASIGIRSTPEHIWRILTDGEKYPSWNPVVLGIEGKIAPNQKVMLRSVASPGRSFPLTVTTFEPGRKMVWTGAMPLGLFKGERTFTLASKGLGMVEFTMAEEFSGLLAPLITRSIPDLQPTFDEFAAALKKAAEA